MEAMQREKVKPSESHHLNLDSLFAVIIDETALVEYKLRIPTKSAMIFGEELSELATLTVPYGHRPWQVTLKKNEENIIWLIDGLEEFIKYYSIHFRSILQFIYRGNSEFSVRICDALGSEIDYPFYGPNFEEDNEEETASDSYSIEKIRGSFGKQKLETRVYDHNVEVLDVKTDGSSKRKSLDGVLEKESFEKSTQNVSNRRERGKCRKRGRNSASMNRSVLSEIWYRTRSNSRIKELQAEGQDVGNANISGRSKPKENNNTSRSRNLPVKHEVDVEMIVPRILSYSESSRPAMSKETEKAVHAAFRCNLQNPSFMIVLTPYIMSHRALDVPVKFVKKHLMFCSETIQLQACNDSQKWPVKCYFKYKDVSCSVIKRMGQGWGPFSASKNLQEGDVCVFELISKVKGIVLKVWIYRAADYAGPPPQKRHKAN